MVLCLRFILTQPNSSEPWAWLNRQKCQKNPLGDFLWANRVESHWHWPHKCHQHLRAGTLCVLFLPRKRLGTQWEVICWMDCYANLRLKKKSIHLISPCSFIHSVDLSVSKVGSPGEGCRHLRQSLRCLFGIHIVQGKSGEARLDRSSSVVVVSAYKVLANPVGSSGACPAPQSILCWVDMAGIYAHALLSHC